MKINGIKKSTVALGAEGILLHIVEHYFMKLIIFALIGRFMETEYKSLR
jgi:formate hydrogenlyase subunit 3/multisubunit Na+/H+ antiporter MnhD subunit